MTSNPSQNMYELLIGENILSIGDKKNLIELYLICGVEGGGYSWETNTFHLISVGLTCMDFISDSGQVP